MTNKKFRKWLVKAGLIVAMFSIVAGATSCTGTGPEVGKQAPDFTLGTMAGTEITLSELRGMPVVLNFWDTVCSPCHYQLAYLEQAAEQSGGEIAIIAVDIGEPLSRIEQFFGDYNLHFTVALDTNAQVSYKYNVRYTPTTFFIDSTGVIRAIKIGASETELWAGIETIRGSTS
jgi:cytochrome c biogenesis protein CcmG/thiol:disulfide interchange protein DsbE